MRLYFGENEIALVTRLDADFPNMYGRFELVEGIHKLQHVLHYVRADVESEEERFLDLIESDHWFLVDDAGERTPIMAPVFDRDGTMVWRYR